MHLCVTVDMCTTVSVAWKYHERDSFSVLDWLFLVILCVLQVCAFHHDATSGGRWTLTSIHVQFNTSEVHLYVS